MVTDDYYGFAPQLEPGDAYTSPEGYLVFTEQYLLKRGYCCKNGCRHCPYGFKKSGISLKNSKHGTGESKRND